MSIVDEAKQAILDLADLTSGFMHGSSPDPMSVLGYQARIVRLHMQLGEEMSRKFGAKEKSYLERKIKQAEQHEHGRIQLKRSSKDSEELAFRAVRKEFEDEIGRMTDWEMHRTLMKSLQNAFDYCRSVVSFLKSAESNDSSQPSS